MDQHDDAAHKQYPLGRGYGHDYMRGGEVFGGYGYQNREEYARTRGERPGGAPDAPPRAGAEDDWPDHTPTHQRSR